MLKTTLLKAVEAGAKELRRYFNNDDLKISNKEGINNWVTEADHASEKAIIEVIKADFPAHFILSERAGFICTYNSGRAQCFNILRLFYNNVIA